MRYLEIQNPHLSDDNISRGFFLVPIIEIFESTFAVAEEASIDESLPGIAVVEEVTCGGDRATWKASADLCAVTSKVFVDNVLAVVAVGGGGSGEFLDFLGKKDGTPFVVFLPLDLKS